jgi:hypothetical protein
MPTLFISYKRGTAAVAPLMERLKADCYRCWFDRDEIHLGDPDWQARIDTGIQQCDGVILNITPAACQSEPVRYEVRKARELGRPIFPVVLERIASYDEAIRDLGLADKQHIEDFTDVTKWDEQVERLLKDLQANGLRVTPHDRRARRDPDNPKYVLHQRYLRQVAEQVGMLSLAQITPENAAGIELERVYVDLPTGLSLSVETKDWQTVDWWLSEGDERLVPDWLVIKGEGRDDIKVERPRPRPSALGYEDAPFEALLGTLDDWIAAYRKQNPDAKPEDKYRTWNNGAHPNVIGLHLNHLAAARRRLVILGAPGSGKSTFVKYLALCLAGAGLDGWTRQAGLKGLDNWPHGALTPVYIELRRFVASAHFPKEVSTPPSADHLWAYIQAEILGVELTAYAEDLRYDLEHGHALLILDGLDEVPYPEGQLKARQQQLVHLAHSLNTRYTSSRVIVASRPYAYEGWTLPDFQAVTITAFEDSHRAALAERLYRAAGLDEGAAKQKAVALNEQLEPIDPELKDRPLFVTLMATIYLRGESEGLPTRRGALYRESILLLLDRWTRGKAGAPSLLQILGDLKLEDVLERLAALAYAVHEQAGDQQGTPEIDEGVLYTHLKPLGRGVAIELIPYLSENAGVLVSPGQDAERDVFHFAHRTFQEYLAAAHLVRLCQQADSFDLVRDHICSRPQVWRVPCMLAGDVLADTGRRADVWGVVSALVADDPPGSGDDPHWWQGWLAATISSEQRLYEQKLLNKLTEKPVRDALVAWLVALIEKPGALSPVEWAACGRALGLLGDPRPGVGLRPDGLPDIVWCEVNDSQEWTYQNEKHPALPPYKIAKYPISYRQFQAFIDDKIEGWNDPRWWQGLAAADEHKTQSKEQEFKFWNHPRENVSWYDAIAFCRWLSFKLGGGYALDKVGEWAVRLPTEQEWERAARGMDGRKYPYGDSFDAAKGNTSETGIGQTSAVGIFPDGVSPVGALDMSGNVWEWCLTDYSHPAADAAGEVLSSNKSRVVRGGCGTTIKSSPAPRIAATSLRTLVSTISVFGFLRVSPSSESLGAGGAVRRQPQARSASPSCFLLSPRSGVKIFWGGEPSSPALRPQGEGCKTNRCVFHLSPKRCSACWLRGQGAFKGRFLGSRVFS